MKKRTMAILMVFALLLGSTAFFTPCQAKTKKFWLIGNGKANADACTKKESKKLVIITYKGYKVSVKGYAWKGKTFDKAWNKSLKISKIVKLKKKTYKVSKKCKVCLGGGSPTISYKRFLKENGKKGNFDWWPCLEIKNGKVVKMWCLN